MKPDEKNTDDLGGWQVFLHADPHQIKPEPLICRSCGLTWKARVSKVRGWNRCPFCGRLHSRWELLG